MPLSDNLAPLDLSRFFEQHPQLETERLILRSLRPEDKEAIYDYASDPEVTRYMLFNTHASIADAEAFLEWRAERYAKRQRIEFALDLKSSGDLVGLCGLHNFFRADQHVELGYVLRRKFWGNGYMAEAVREVIRFAFEEMGMHRVQAICFEDNVRSARLMERCGMTYEGMFRDQLIVRGQFITNKLYSILRQEFAEQKAPPSSSAS
jgi:ribosomal-protein-alanine N-acetyltransferase